MLAKIPTGIIMMAASTREPFALDMPRLVIGVEWVNAIFP